MIVPRIRTRPQSASCWPSERFWLLVAAGIVLTIYGLPYLYLGEDAYLTIADNLDDSSSNFKALMLSGQAFSFQLDSRLPNVMNGLPRTALGSCLHYQVWLFALVPTYWAFVLNLVFVHVVGLAGMYLFLRAFVLAQSTDTVGAVSIALLFSLIPTYASLGLSVMGQPLLWYAFCRLRQGQATWKEWGIITLFPFFSYLVFAGLFLLIGLIAIGLRDGWLLRQTGLGWVTCQYWLAIVFLGLMYGIADFPMIWAYLTQQYIPHRVEFTYTGQSVGKAVRETITTFLKGQYHAGLLLTFVPLALWVNTLRYWPLPVVKRTSLLVGLCFLTALFHGFYPLLVYQLGPKTKLTQAFQLDRFYVLLPFSWCVIMAFSLRISKRTAWIYALLSLQFFLAIAVNDEWLTNVRLVSGKAPIQRPTYRAFFAESLFTAIKFYIGKPTSSYRVVSIGMHPAVAQYNGFYTLDSYQNNYPLPYKHQFRQMIAQELAKDEAVCQYFDGWGSRCYVFPAELKLDCLISKTSSQVINHLHFSTDVFRAMGGEYVLSAVPINNAAENQLSLCRVFTDQNSYWRIWLYQVQITRRRLTKITT